MVILAYGIYKNYIYPSLYLININLCKGSAFKWTLVVIIKIWLQGLASQGTEDF